MDLKEKLSLVILDNFHSLNSDVEVRSVFGNLLHLKSAGYGKYFSDAFVPYDGLDYISRYYLLCVNEMDPITCIRMLSFKKACYHNLTIPLVKFAQDSGSKRHVNFINGLLTKGDCLYSGNFTVHPDYRNKEFLEFAKNFVSAMTYMEMLTGNYHAILAAGTLRMKTDQSMSIWGYENIYDSEGELPNLIKKESNNEIIKLMMMSSPSLHGKESVNLIETNISKKIDLSLKYKINNINVA